jgi:ribosome maturation factor RimP
VANEPPRDWTPFLGRKVSIRFRLEGDPQHEFSEAIGVIQSVTDTDGGQRIEIVKRRGQVVSVPAPHILAAKMWP